MTHAEWPTTVPAYAAAEVHETGSKTPPPSFEQWLRRQRRSSPRRQLSPEWGRESLRRQRVARPGPGSLVAFRLEGSLGEVRGRVRRQSPDGSFVVDVPGGMSVAGVRTITRCSVLGEEPGIGASLRFGPGVSR